MPGKHDIYILEVGDGYRVRPALWSYDSSGNRKVKFRNLTNKNVRIVLPTALVNQGDPTSEELTPSAQGAASVWQPDLKHKSSGTPETYRYAVLVETPDGLVLAAGESEPIIIIDPPA
jgi:hypothetical protein